jgi:hypothetical protein
MFSGRAHYALSWQKPYIVITFPHDAFQAIKENLSPHSPIVKSMEKKFKRPFKIFSSGEDSLFGEIFFGVGTGLSVEETSSGKVIKANLSVFQQEEFEEEARRMRFDLAVLFEMFLAFSRVERDDFKSGGLATINNFCTGGYPAGGGFCVTLSPKVVAWTLGVKDKKAFLPIQKAMIDAWKCMSLPGERQFKHEFRAHSYHHGFISLRVFGNACDLGRTDTGQSVEDALKTGYELSPHNVDSPHQQFSLLAGVAALCDAVRKNKKPPR